MPPAPDGPAPAPLPPLLDPVTPALTEPPPPGPPVLPAPLAPRDDAGVSVTSGEHPWATAIPIENVKARSVMRACVLVINRFSRSTGAEQDGEGLSLPAERRIEQPTCQHESTTIRP